MPSKPCAAKARGWRDASRNKAGQPSPGCRMPSASAGKNGPPWLCAAEVNTQRYTDEVVIRFRVLYISANDLNMQGLPGLP